MEERRVKLAPQEEPPALVPPEGRAVVPAIPGERLQVPGGVGELEDAGEYPRQEVAGALVPAARYAVGPRREDWKLLKIAVGEMSPTDLLPRGVVQGERGHV